MTFDFIKLFTAAVFAGTPLLLGTLGEILTEKSGNLNLGVEGMMYMGAVSGLAGAYFTEIWFNGAGLPAVIAALIFSFLAGCLGALIYAFLTISMRADQNVTGLTLTIFGTGFAKFFGELMGQKAGGYVKVAAKTARSFGKMKLGGLSKIPVVGELFFHYNFMVYLALILTLALAFFLNRTRKGLNLQAVGEDPSTADSAGIPVARYRYFATVLGGGICGLGGMYMSMVNQKGIWVPECVSGYGWLAVALVIFSTWNPLRALYCGLIFGGFTILRMYVPVPGLATQLYDMLPYVATVLVLIATSIRQSKEHRQPAGCGHNYFREDR